MSTRKWVICVEYINLKNMFCLRKEEKKSTLYFITKILLLSGCISSSSLLKKADQNNLNNQISGSYNNIDTSSNGLSLWQALYYCQSFKEDTALFTEKSTISLDIESNNKLKVIRWERDIAVDTITLKTKKRDNYISVKRNLQLIPIPLLFYRYHETKVILAVSNDGDLVLGYSRKQFIWTILAGSIDQKATQIHQKEK